MRTAPAALLWLGLTLGCSEIKPTPEAVHPVSATSAVATPRATACELELAGPAMVLVPQSAGPFNIAAAAVGDRWLVAYQLSVPAETPDGPRPIVVRGRFYDSEGRPVTDELALSDTHGIFVLPTIVASEGRLFVSWQRQLGVAGFADGNGTLLQGRWVEPDGRLSGAVTLPIQDPDEVAITAAPGGLAVIWGDVRFRTVEGELQAAGDTVKRRLFDRKLSPVGPVRELIDVRSLGIGNLAELPLAKGGTLVAVASAGFRDPSVDKIHLLRLDAAGVVTSVVMEIPSPGTAARPSMLHTDSGILLGWVAENADRSRPAKAMLATIDEAGTLLREPHVIGVGGGRFAGSELSRVRGIPTMIYDGGRIQQLTEDGDPITTALKVPPANASYGWWLALGNDTGLAWIEKREQADSVNFARIGCK